MTQRSVNTSHIVPHAPIIPFAEQRNSGNTNDNNEKRSLVALLLKFEKDCRTKHCSENAKLLGIEFLMFVVCNAVLPKDVIRERALDKIFTKPNVLKYAEWLFTEYINLVGSAKDPSISIGFGVDEALQKDIQNQVNYSALSTSLFGLLTMYGHEVDRDQFNSKFVTVQEIFKNLGSRKASLDEPIQQELSQSVLAVFRNTEFVVDSDQDEVAQDKSNSLDLALDSSVSSMKAQQGTQAPTNHVVSEVDSFQVDNKPSNAGVNIERNKSKIEFSSSLSDLETEEELSVTSGQREQSRPSQDHDDVHSEVVNSSQVVISEQPVTDNAYKGTNTDTQNSEKKAFESIQSESVDVVMVDSSSVMEPPATVQSIDDRTIAEDLSQRNATLMEIEATRSSQESRIEKQTISSKENLNVISSSSSNEQHNPQSQEADTSILSDSAIDQLVNKLSLIVDGIATTRSPHKTDTTESGGRLFSADDETRSRLMEVIAYLKSRPQTGPQSMNSSFDQVNGQPQSTQYSQLDQNQNGLRASEAIENLMSLLDPSSIRSELNIISNTIQSMSIQIQSLGSELRVEEFERNDSIVIFSNFFDSKIYQLSQSMNYVNDQIKVIKSLEASNLEIKEEIKGQEVGQKDLLVRIDDLKELVDALKLAFAQESAHIKAQAIQYAKSYEVIKAHCIKIAHFYDELKSTVKKQSLKMQKDLSELKKHQDQQRAEIDSLKGLAKENHQFKTALESMEQRIDEERYKNSVFNENKNKDNERLKLRVLELETRLARYDERFLRLEGFIKSNAASNSQKSSSQGSNGNSSLLPLAQSTQDPIRVDSSEHGRQTHPSAMAPHRTIGPSTPNPFTTAHSDIGSSPRRTLGVGRAKPNEMMSRTLIDLLTRNKKNEHSNKFTPQLSHSVNIQGIPLINSAKNTPEKETQKRKSPASPLNLGDFSGDLKRLKLMKMVDNSSSEENSQ